MKRAPIPVLHTLAVLIALLPAVALADVAGQATVIDGDTIEIHRTRIRLHGPLEPWSAGIPGKPPTRTSGLRRPVARPFVCPPLAGPHLPSKRP